MNKAAELIKRLPEFNVENYNTWDVESVSLWSYEAADLLEAQAKQIANLDMDYYAKCKELELAHESYAKQIEALQADAERGLFMIDNGCWHRGEEQTHLAVLVPQGSDLSCVATRRAAIDAAKGNV